ncbi:uncharacterized protein LOC143446834 isoform X1 [Clavelina lepadiformis]|uniref:uncharacterized protein LOC143446834 isoform X1 n=1 Tax=Clavelina lepadiformis TaxID=159417 RepID=UPI0040432E65
MKLMTNELLAVFLCLGLGMVVFGFQEDVDMNDEQDMEKPDHDFDEIKISRVLDIGDSHTAWVIDNAISKEAAEFYSDTFDQLTQFRGYSYENIMKNIGTGKDEKYGNAPWTKSLDVDNFQGTFAWKNLQPHVEKLLENEVVMEYGQMELLRALDVVAPMRGRYCASNRHVLTIYLTSQWNLNNYGQASFYQKVPRQNEPNSSRLEITQSVHPHAYRAILWPSCHTVLFRAPCVNYFHRLKYLNLWITTDPNNDENPPFPAPFTPQSDEEFADFHFTNFDADRKIDFHQHLVRSFNDGSEDRTLHIFDDLFTTDEVRQWKSHLLKSLPQGNSYDTDQLEDNDNVQWISAYDVESFMKTDMWPRFLALCEFVSNETEWYPYDVALNFVRSADHTRIHPDSEPHQTELTMVFYLNEGLVPSDYGETTFVVLKEADGVHEFIGQGGEVYEAIATVTPKFGRIAIFRNNIEHSAHPPSTQFTGVRFTFALKVSRTKHLSLVKRTYEMMENLDLTHAQEQLNERLMSGELDDPRNFATEKLEKLHKKVSQQIRDTKQKMHREALAHEI